MGRTTLADVGQYETYQGVPVGLGPRVPLLVLSPWSKGGRVCSQLLDHTSKLRFLEQWLVQGLGKDPAAVRCDQISPWRRAVCGDLTSAFDFRAPNAAWPASVPARASYEPVTGKPEPAPPAVQTLPRQEPGTRPACALPYALAVDGRAGAAHRFTLDFSNTGSAGACFIVHTRERTDGPWFYTVEAGRSITGETWTWSAATYDLRVQGPNGMLRHFRGSTARAGGPEVVLREHAGTGSVVLTLTNPTTQSCTFTIADTAYGGAVQARAVPPGQAAVLELALASSHGWYDLMLALDTDATWMRHLAGHVETGQASVTDPQIGRTRAAPPLVVRPTVVNRGAAASVAYAAPDDRRDPRNWIGVYAHGATPGQGGGALEWSYAPGVSGTASLTSAALAVGEYAAWLLYQDGYAVLAGPVPFVVTQLSTANPAVPRGSPVSFEYAVPAARVAAKNWIGIWRAGAAPIAGTWLSWQYAPAPGGTLQFDTSGLATGSYVAWLFHDDGYVLLGGPCPIQIG
jgi:phospholipase C